MNIYPTIKERKVQTKLSQQLDMLMSENKHWKTEGETNE